MLSWFNYYGHMCLVFELLGLSVFDFLVSIKSTRVMPLLSNLTRHLSCRKRTIIILTLWTKSVTLRINCAGQSNSCMNANWHTQIWNQRIFCLSHQTGKSVTTPKRYLWVLLSRLQLNCLIFAETRYKASEKHRSQTHWFRLCYIRLGASFKSCLNTSLSSSRSDIR